MENDIKPKSEENLLTKVSTFNQFLEQKVESMLLKILNIARYIFIVMMIVYLGQCFVSLGYKMVAFTISQGALDFDSIKIILTDSLFVLIVLAIVKTLFIQDGFDYAITFLEISFVVLVRKLILLETDPSETMILLVLGITSAMFFILIVYIHGLKHKWAKEKCEEKRVD
ncbi:hypothetical protein SUSP_002301 [Sulfurospirillum sp. 'SP']|nr:hypothetical protein [Sulfurospirillum sp. 'SP']WNY99883.1 hypothetical protein SUSP_002301 [Sulfurospirillum sp. 'SP']